MPSDSGAMAKPAQHGMHYGMAHDDDFCVLSCNPASLAYPRGFHWVVPRPGNGCTPMETSTCPQSHLPCIEAAKRSHASDSTELRMLPADSRIARAAEPRMRRDSNNRSEESSSLIPDVPQITCKRVKGATMRPLVIKGCLPKGYYFPITCS